MVLEGTAEDTNAGGSQCRGNGIAGVGRVALPIEGKWEVHITLDQLSGSRVQSICRFLQFSLGCQM
jgi:hypothetical protein